MKFKNIVNIIIISIIVLSVVILVRMPSSHRARLWNAVKTRLPGINRIITANIDTETNILGTEDTLEIIANKYTIDYLVSIEDNKKGYYLDVYTYNIESRFEIDPEKAYGSVEDKSIEIYLPEVTIRSSLSSEQGNPIRDNLKVDVTRDEIIKPILTSIEEDGINFARTFNLANSANNTIKEYFQDFFNALGDNIDLNVVFSDSNEDINDIDFPRLPLELHSDDLLGWNKSELIGLSPVNNLLNKDKSTLSWHREKSYTKSIPILEKELLEDSEDDIIVFRIIKCYKEPNRLSPVYKYTLENNKLNSYYLNNGELFGGRFIAPDYESYKWESGTAITLFDRIFSSSIDTDKYEEYLKFLQIYNLIIERVKSNGGSLSDLIVELESLDSKKDFIQTLKIYNDSVLNNKNKILQLDEEYPLISIYSIIRNNTSNSWDSIISNLKDSFTDAELDDFYAYLVYKQYDKLSKESLNEYTNHLTKKGNIIREIWDLPIPDYVYQRKVLLKLILDNNSLMEDEHVLYKIADSNYIKDGDMFMNAPYMVFTSEVKEELKTGNSFSYRQLKDSYMDEENNSILTVVYSSKTLKWVGRAKLNLLMFNIDSITIVEDYLGEEPIVTEKSYDEFVGVSSAGWLGEQYLKNNSIINLLNQLSGKIESFNNLEEKILLKLFNKNIENFLDYLKYD